MFKKTPSLPLIQEGPRCLLRVRGVYPSLTPSERRVADYCLNFPGEVLNLSLRELAGRAETSEATVVRFCKAMGFDGFQDMKTALVPDLILLQRPIYDDIHPDDTIQEALRKLFGLLSQTLEDTLSLLESSELDRAIESIESAGNIALYATGGSGGMAEIAAYKFLSIGIRCVPYVNTAMQQASFSLLQEGDVAIGVSHSGTNPSVLAALEAARKRGALSICLTNFTHSPIVKLADIKLFTSVPSGPLGAEAGPVRIAQLAVFDALTLGVIMQRKTGSHPGFPENGS